ncbi:putative Sperm-associated antigen 7-like protein [Hypsibius exemplaris]|uniref:Sperm-associated antigen 7-like protein n=1 Tax=Hypsibius exemplaris TaxID=2072580 RepID=A0A1W0X4R9_HYPEX|nr:putative Sperm-associated antigen 7-like protein [Hypsibius exemplaris]
MDIRELLSKQQGPPPQSASRKKEIAEARKADEARKKYLANYRLQATNAIAAFAADSARLKMKFSPADKTVRSIVHEIAEGHELVSHSFGEEGVNRHVYLFKKEYDLTEAELQCYRAGRKWEPSPVLPARAVAPSEPTTSNALPKTEPLPSLNLQSPIKPPNKSERVMARLAARSAELVQISRDSFGDVPVAGKTDRRTIAQVQADIQAKKKRKLLEVEREADPRDDS